MGPVNGGGEWGQWGNRVDEEARGRGLLGQLWRWEWQGRSGHWERAIRATRALRPMGNKRGIGAVNGANRAIGLMKKPGAGGC